MSGEFEEEYLDVLQNIEAALASAYRQHSSMTDYDAWAAVDVLIRDYQAEMKGRPAPNVHMSNVARDAYEAARSVCEWRIGRGAFMDEQRRELHIPESSSLTLEEIVACLKRIRKSIDRWNKELGRRGYVDFISQFSV